jgi:hypothetical protein
MYHFCTYFDRNYLAQGLALYRSLVEHAGDFRLWVLCFDDPTFEFIGKMALENLRPIALRDFEAGDEALRRAKANRSRVEYYFTCSPSWPLYLLNRFPEIDLVTYLDADLLFYSDPRPIYEELGDRSILIIGHRFPERLRFMEHHGIYNVGLVAFRNDGCGRKCLEWWRERCLEWCYDRLEEGRFADQKYLDDWPERFGSVAVLRHKGAGLAPWNWMNYSIVTEDGKTSVDGQPLVFYHFQGVRLLTNRLFDPGVLVYGRMPTPLRRHLYIGYLKTIRDAERWASGTVRDAGILSPRMQARNYGWPTFLWRLLQGQIMIVPK